MGMTRRALVTGAAALAIAPRLVRAEMSDDGFTVIRARALDARLMGSDGPPAKVWSYADAAPPLILRTRQGVEAKFRFVNELDRAINVHWHGVRGPSAAMSLVIEPADHAVDCVFTPPDAGTFWFGPVSDCSRLRDMGLYGLLVVDESGDTGATLEDVPLVFDDWRLSNDGVIDTEFGSLVDAIGQGRLGNWFTVNGQFRPRIAAGTGLLRLRIANVANVRTISLVFKGASQWLIANDGQPVQPQALGTKGVELAPGQRADLLVDPGSEEITIALDLFEDTVETAYIARTGAPAAADLPDNWRLPANPLPAAGALDGLTAIPLVIEGGEKGGMTGALYQGQQLELRALLEKGMAWALNGTAGLPASPWQTFTQGSTVLFAIENRTAFDQSLYIQGHVWRLVEDEAEVWRDTLVVAGGKSARAVFVAANPGEWRLHSTIAERLDAGLITSFVVAPA